MGGHAIAAVDWDKLARLTPAEVERHLAPFDAQLGRVHPETGVEVDPLVLASDGGRLLAPGRYRDLVVPERDGAIVVDGDLTVEGVLEHPFRSCPLLVAGDLRCDHLVTCAYLVVMGSVEIGAVFYGNCTNYDTAVFGDLRAKEIVREKNHHLAVFGEVRCELHLDDEVDGYDATEAWMNARGVSAHDEPALAASLRGRS